MTVFSPASRILIAATLTIAGMSATDAFGQPGGRGGFRGGPPGGGGVGFLLMSEDVQGEINLDSGQQSDLDALRQDIQDDMRDAFRNMRDLSPEERREEFELLRADAEGRIQKILKPEQWDRLRQIELQQQLQFRGGGAVAEGRLAEELGLSDSQKEEMQRKALEAQQELQKKIQQLQLEAREEVLSVLTTEQRAKYDKMVGTPFEMQQPRFGRGPGGQGRGGQGRQGGRQRGGRGGGGSPELE